MNDTISPRLIIAAAAMLRPRKGEQFSITIGDLAGRLGISHRACEALIEENIAAFDFPLCAGSHGLFVPAEAHEINHYMESLRARSLKIFMRRKTVRAQAKKAGFDFRGGRFFDPPSMQPELFNVGSAPVRAFEKETPHGVATNTEAA